MADHSAPEGLLFQDEEGLRRALHTAADDLVASADLRTGLIRTARDNSSGSSAVLGPRRRSWFFGLAAASVVVALVLSVFGLRPPARQTVGPSEPGSTSGSAPPTPAQPAAQEGSRTIGANHPATWWWTAADCAGAQAITPKPFGTTAQITDATACVDATATPIALSSAQRATVLAALTVPDVSDHDGVWCSDPALPPITVVVRLRDGTLAVPLLPRSEPNCFVPVRALTSLLSELWAENPLSKQPAGPRSPSSGTHWSVGSLSTTPPQHNPCQSGIGDATAGQTLDQLVVCRPSSTGSTDFVPTPREQSANLAALVMEDPSQPREANDGISQGCMDPAMQIRYVAKLSSGRWVNIIQPREHGGCLVPVPQVLAFNRRWISRIPLK